MNFGIDRLLTERELRAPLLGRRVALLGMIQYSDVLVPWYRFGAVHDLTSGGYIAGGLDNEIKEPVQFNVKGRVGDFQPDALRRLGGTL